MVTDEETNFAVSDLAIKAGIFVGEHTVRTKSSQSTGQISNGRMIVEAWP
jgi:hypothetical protein